MVVSDEPRVVRKHARPVPLGALGIVLRTPKWQPNWIDYRASLARIDRREDADETVDVCDHCGCELDRSQVPHSPRCAELAPALEEAVVHDLGPATAASPSADNPYGLVKRGRGFAWTREAAIRAFLDFRAGTGDWPTYRDAKDNKGSLPSQKPIQDLFGSIKQAIAVAKASSSEREPDGGTGAGRRGSVAAAPTGKQPSRSEDAGAGAEAA